MKKQQPNDAVVSLIWDLLDEMKAYNTVRMNVAKMSTLTENLIITSATSTTHAKAIANFVEDEMKKYNNPPARIDGIIEGTWIVMDFGTTIVHIFAEDLREYYHLEKLWSDGKNIQNKKELK